MNLADASLQDPVILVYGLPEASQITDELRNRGAAGRIITCHTQAEVAEHIAQADILMGLPFDLTLLKKATRLRWIQSFSAGVEGWLGAPLSPEIPITRMVGVFERYMAEYVFAHLLYDTQELKLLREAQRNREWPHLNTQSLRGQVMGIAGFGYTGAAVARLAHGFGMEVWAFRRRPDRPPGHEAQAARVFGPPALHGFLSGLDVLVLTLPATPETAGIMGRAELETLPAHATLINIGRGALVDEEALIVALREGHLRRAVIDTFHEEPLPRDSPLWDLPNLTITPHMAGAVYAQELAEVCARNLREFLRGSTPRPTVDLAAGY